MKRKRKKLKLLNANRPLLDLPKSHPLRKRIESHPATSGWGKVTLPQGWRFYSTANHKLALGTLANMAPEILKADLPPLETLHQILQLTHPEKDLAVVLIGSWFPPDADDPDRLESGWALRMIYGPRADIGKMFDWAKTLVKNELDQGRFDIFTPA